MIHVLIVEDDPMVAKLNKCYVESVEGFKVVNTVNDGEKALEFLKKQDVDLIILDIYMPQLDGISFLKEMRKNSIEADVLFVTAAKETDKIDAGLKLGAIDYLIKPFEYDRMRKSLENYTERYNVLRSEDVIKQEDIDKITTKNPLGHTELPPKGLHQKTLKRVRKIMKENRGKLVSSGEIAEKIGVSRVTIRRYLEYLVSIQEIILEIEYGGIGRPNHRYKYIGK